jgi:hypothetical protein
MKTRVYVIVLLAISATLLIVSSGSTFVLADPCTATLSYPLIPAQYGNSNVPIVVPILASCTTSYGGQLYATGSAYDVTSNTGLGSASTVLSSVSGATEFNGQLGFNVPPTSPGDSVQISVSIYSSQYGSLITETSETVQLGTGVQQTTTTTVTVGQYPYAIPSPTAYPSPYQPNQSQYYGNQPPYQYQYQQGNQGHHWYYFSQGYPYGSNNQNLFEWVAIVAILAAVIIATTGLVLIARRQQPPQPAWYPVPPPNR